MVYLLIFAFNVALLEPVIIKDCLPYKSPYDQGVHNSIMDLQKMSNCEKSPDSFSWTCIDQKNGIISKAVILRDIKECRDFPKKTTDALKKLMPRK